MEAQIKDAVDSAAKAAFAADLPSLEELKRDVFAEEVA